MENKYIYVCSPYGGLMENYERAIKYGQYVLNQGYVPMIPHTMLHGIVDDRNPEQRERALQAGQAMLKLCAEVWVFGTQKDASIGMRSEIAAATEWGIPVKYIDGVKALEIDCTATDIRLCLSHYERTYCTINCAIAEDIIHYIKLGISAELLNLCIDIAARKNARWNYSLAILERCVAQGIHTTDAFKNQRNTPQSESAAAYDLKAFERMLNSD